MLAGGWLVVSAFAGCGEGRPEPPRAEPTMPTLTQPVETLADAGGLRGPVLRTASPATPSWGTAPAAGEADARTPACGAAETAAAGEALSIRAQVDLQRIRRCARRWWWS